MSAFNTAVNIHDNDDIPLYISKKWNLKCYYNDQSSHSQNTQFRLNLIVFNVIPWSSGSFRVNRHRPVFESWHNLITLLTSDKNWVTVAQNQFQMLISKVCLHCNLFLDLAYKPHGNATPNIPQEKRSRHTNYASFRSIFLSDKYWMIFVNQAVTRIIALSKKLTANLSI